MELDQVLLGLDGGGGDCGPFLHPAELFLVAGRGGDGAVIQPVEAGDGCHQIGEDVGLLHAQPHRPGDVLGEEDGGVGSTEEFLHHVGALALDLDVEALELPLVGVQPLQGGALVVGTGVQLLQHLGKGLTRLVVHAFFQL